MKESTDYQPTGKTIAFDLDGVLAQYTGWKGKDFIGEPIDGMRELLRELKLKGVRIIIHTTRGAHETQMWADKHDMPYDWININGDLWTQKMGKPYADIYVDDRAICFGGSVQILRRQLLRFRPYTGTK